MVLITEPLKMAGLLASRFCRQPDTFPEKSSGIHQAMTASQSRGRLWLKAP